MMKRKFTLVIALLAIIFSAAAQPPTAKVQSWGGLWSKTVTDRVYLTKNDPYTYASEVTNAATATWTFDPSATIVSESANKTIVTYSAPGAKTATFHVEGTDGSTTLDLPTAFNVAQPYGITDNVTNFLPSDVPYATSYTTGTAYNYIFGANSANYVIAETYTIPQDVTLSVDSITFFVYDYVIPMFNRARSFVITFRQFDPETGTVGDVIQTITSTYATVFGPNNISATMTERPPFTFTPVQITGSFVIIYDFTTVGAPAANNRLGLASATGRSFEHSTAYSFVSGALVTPTSAGAPLYTSLRSYIGISYADAPLAVDQRIPENGAPDVAVDAAVSAIFNKNITAGNLTSITIKDADGVEVVGVDPSITGNVLAIAHAPFAPGVTYTVSIPVGSITGYTEAITWSFTTGIAAITGEVVSPEAGAEGVELDEPIVVVFDKDVATYGAPDFSNAVLIAEDESEIPLTTVSTSGTEIVFTHPELSYNSAYTVFIPAAAVIGLAGDILSGFSTKQLPLAITGQTPADADVALDAAVTATFNRAITLMFPRAKATITPSTGANEGVLSLGEGGTVLNVSHAAFAPNTAYTVRVPDVAIIGWFEPITWSFTTKKESGINDVKTSVAVYPTISKGQITVNTTANASIKITDISGRVLAAYHSEGILPIDLNYVNGIYFVVIENGKAVTTHKVVLQK